LPWSLVTFRRARAASGVDLSGNALVPVYIEGL
jgi:hypothetical protein